MSRTASTEPHSLYITIKPLLPFWSVNPVQSNSVCKEHIYLYFPYGA